MRLDKIKLKDLEQETNILSLEVPEELEKTISVGIPFLDRTFGGEGCTPSACALFTGVPGAGKTTMMLQMADAITSTGNMCLFNTAEESPLQVRKVVKRLRQKNGFYIGQDRLVSKIFSHSKLLMTKNPSKQLFVVCDSLATMDDGYYQNGYTNTNTPVRVAEAMADFCKTRPFPIVILIGQVTKSQEFSGKQAIRHTLDIHLHLSLDDDEKSDTYGMRLLEATKNRFGPAGLVSVLNMLSTGLEEVGSFNKIASK